MYTPFFRLTQPPFSIAPDPRYLFMSERHREALAHLLYGINSGGGVVLLTGEIGAGKTTVCRCFLEQVPADCNVAYIFNPKLTANELLQAVCDEFGIAVQRGGAGAAGGKGCVDALNRYLLARHGDGQSNVLIIDEAQNLSAEVLEQLRLLTNLETSERKLLQIILIGQPELRAMLAKPELEQLAQRVIARYHLDALAEDETARYIAHRLAVAGEASATPFPRQMMKEVHRRTQGVPRRINLLCDRALLGAYVEGKHEIDRGILRRAAAEVFDGKHAAAARNPQRWRYAAWGAAAGAAAVGIAVWSMGVGMPAKTLASAVAMAAPRPPVAAIGPEAMPPDNAPALPASAEQWDADQLIGAGLKELNDAVRHMAQLWDVKLEDELPCRAAQEKNLHCYLGSRAKLDEIRQLNRPVTLTLHNDNGKIYYAVLTAMTDKNATLSIGSVARTMPLHELARQFHGRFVTFWRAPYLYRELVGLGHRGAETDWIGAQLAKLNGVEAPPSNRPFDRKMAQRVREFQQAQGIKADGVAGPRTFMQLNRVAGIKEPALRRTAAGAILSSGE